MERRFQSGDRVIIARTNAPVWENEAGTVVRYESLGSKLVDIRMDLDDRIHGFYEHRLEFEDTKSVSVSEATLIEILSSI